MDISKCVIGKEGWLFLHNDTNEVFKQISGGKRLPERLLAIWGEELERRAGVCSDLGCSYQYLIIPNKHCVYAEMLPEGTVLSDERPAIQLRDDSRLVQYPLDLLREKRNELPLFLKTDTHWTSVGAAVVWNDVARRCRIPVQLPLDRYRQVEVVGDLGGKLRPRQKSCNAILEIPFAARKVWDNRFNNRGTVKIYRQDNSGLPRCVIFGDSFTNVAIDYIAEFFSELHFFHSINFDRAIVESIGPDMVVNCSIERFMNCPSYFTGYSFYGESLNFMRMKKFPRRCIERFVGVEENPLYPADCWDEMKRLSRLWLELYDILAERQGSDGELELEGLGLEDLERARVASRLGWISYLQHVAASRLGQAKESESYLKRAVMDDPTVPFFHFRLGVMQWQKGRRSAALEAIRTAISLSPNQASHHAKLAEILYESRHYVEAQEAICSALRLAPHLSGFHVLSSNNQEACGNLDEAIADMWQALELGEPEQNCLTALGRMFRKKGDIVQAEKALLRMVQICPDADMAHYQLSLLYCKKGDYDKAEHHRRLSVRS